MASVPLVSVLDLPRHAGTRLVIHAPGASRCQLPSAIEIPLTTKEHTLIVRAPNDRAKHDPRQWAKFYVNVAL